MVISANGRNMPDVCHFRSLAPMTKNRKTSKVGCELLTKNATKCVYCVTKPLKRTSSVHFLVSFPSSVELNLDRHLTYWLVHAGTWFNTHPESQVLEFRSGLDLSTSWSHSMKTKMCKGRVRGEGEDG